MRTRGRLPLRGIHLCSERCDRGRDRSGVLGCELTASFGVFDPPRRHRTGRTCRRDGWGGEVFGGGGEEPVEVAEWVALVGRVGHEVTAVSVVLLEHAKQPGGSPAGIRVEAMAVQESGEGADVPVTGEPRHSLGELGGEALRPNRDGWFLGGFSARGYAR